MKIKLQARTRLRATAVQAATDPAMKKLKQDIVLRKQYERLKDSAQSRSYTRSKSATQVAKDKFSAWKTANPNYPKEQLKVLVKRLRSLEEQGSPDKKVERKAKEAADKGRAQEIFKLSRQLDSYLDQLKSSKDKYHDYTPDDTTPEKWVSELKRNITDLRNRIKKLKATK